MIIVFHYGRKRVIRSNNSKFR